MSRLRMIFKGFFFWYCPIMPYPGQKCWIPQTLTGFIFGKRVCWLHRPNCYYWVMEGYHDEQYRDHNCQDTCDGEPVKKIKVQSVK